MLRSMPSTRLIEPSAAVDGDEVGGVGGVGGDYLDVYDQGILVQNRRSIPPRTSCWS
jgi:hypothetical protein